MQNTQEKVPKLNSGQVRIPRKRRKTPPKGSVERVSDEVLAALERVRGPKESFDALLRRILNLPNRKGEKPGLFEAWVLPSSGQCFHTRAKAHGAAVMQAAWSKSERVETPVRVREAL